MQCVQIGKARIELEPGRFPTSRRQLMIELRLIAKLCGVKSLHFVNSTSFYGGKYNCLTEEIVVVVREGKKRTSRTNILFRFLHELGHHLHRMGGLFKAYYPRGSKKPTRAGKKRVALRAERHADWLACRLALAIYGLKLELDGKYPKEFLTGR